MNPNERELFLKNRNNQIAQFNTYVKSKTNPTLQPEGQENNFTFDESTMLRSIDDLKFLMYKVIGNKFATQIDSFLSKLSNPFLQELYSDFDIYKEYMVKQKSKHMSIDRFFVLLHKQIEKNLATTRLNNLTSNIKDNLAETKAHTEEMLTHMRSRITTGSGIRKKSKK